MSTYKVFESRESIDYVYVIHRQLDRIATIRTQINIITPERNEADRLKEYIAAVEALYTVLLPELRGNAGEYIRRAYRIYFLLQKIRDSSGEEKSKLKEVMFKVLPKEVLSFLSYTGFYLNYQPAVLVLDLALEEMIKRLNAAGLLIRGREVVVSAVGGVNKGGNKV